jgi:hypothetical protein
MSYPNLLFRSREKGKMAEWSKALVSGFCDKILDKTLVFGRGFESHSSQHFLEAVLVSVALFLVSIL